MRFIPIDLNSVNLSRFIVPGLDSMLISISVDIVKFCFTDFMIFSMIFVGISDGVPPPKKIVGTVILPNMADQYSSSLDILLKYPSQSGLAHAAE